MINYWISIITIPTIQFNIQDLPYFNRETPVNEGARVNTKQEQMPRFQKERIYCGCILTHNKIRADPNRTEAISNIERPTTSKELEKYLGSVQYFSNFMPNFSKIAAPLFDLLNHKKLKESIELYTPNMKKIFTYILMIVKRNGMCSRTVCRK